MGLTQTLSELRYNKILFLNLHDLLAQEHFKLFFFRMIFQTARFDFWSCISNEVKWGQVFYSLHAVFNEFELVKVFAIFFLQVLSVGGDIVSVKTGRRLLFANQLFRFFFFFSVWSIGLPRINFFLINRFVLKYTWILK